MAKNEITLESATERMNVLFVSILKDHLKKIPDDANSQISASVALSGHISAATIALVAVGDIESAKLYEGRVKLFMENPENFKVYLTELLSDLDSLIEKRASVK